MYLEADLDDCMHHSGISLTQILRGPKENFILAKSTVKVFRDLERRSS